MLKKLFSLFKKKPTEVYKIMPQEDITPHEVALLLTYLPHWGDNMRYEKKYIENKMDKLGNAYRHLCLVVYENT